MMLTDGASAGCLVASTRLEKERINTMTRTEYLQRALEALDAGRISEEAYDAMLMNADIFCDDDDDDEDNLPETYAEVEYDDFDDPEAILGARWDDMNYLRYTER